MVVVVDRVGCGRVDGNGSGSGSGLGRERERGTGGSSAEKGLLLVSH